MASEVGSKQRSLGKGTRCHWKEGVSGFGGHFVLLQLFLYSVNLSILFWKQKMLITEYYSVNIWKPQKTIEIKYSIVLPMSQL